MPPARNPSGPRVFKARKGSGSLSEKHAEVQGSGLSRKEAIVLASAPLRAGGTPGGSRSGFAHRQKFVHPIIMFATCSCARYVRDAAFPAPVVMAARRDFFNPAEAYVMTLGDGQSQKRVVQLLNQIARFFGAADLHVMAWQDITYDHVLAFRETRMREGLSPATINLQLSVLKMTAKQCWLKKLIPLDTYAAIREVKSVRGGRVSKGRALKPDESSRLLSSTESAGDIYGVRDAAIIALALGCGLRRSEISSLRLDQVDRIRRTITVLGKGNKERRVALADPVWERLSAWLGIRGEDASPFVFLALRRYGKIWKNHVLSSSAVYHILKNRSVESGVEAFSPHDLRRTFATRLLGAGTDINLVRKAMGHASVLTTQRYDKREDEDVEAATRRILI